MKELLKAPKNMKIIILAVFLGICLLFMSTIIPKSRDKPAQNLKEYAENYRIQTQNELAQMLSETDGVGKCQVLLTIAATEESIENKSTKILMPPINGAYIICEGGNSPVIKEQVTYAVASVLNISTNKVYVSKIG